MNILAQLVLIENKNCSYTPGSGHTFIFAHIDITIIFYLLRFVHANHLQNEALLLMLGQ